MNKNNDLYIVSKIYGGWLDPSTGHLVKYNQAGELLWEKYDDFFIRGKMAVDNNSDQVFSCFSVDTSKKFRIYLFKKISSSGKDLWTKPIIRICKRDIWIPVC